VKKAQYLTKSYEQKLKVVEESKEGLNRRIQELMRVVQDKDAKLMEVERGYEDEIARVTQDRNDIQEQIPQLNYVISKLKSELTDKDNLIGRSVNDNDSEIKLLRQQLEGKKQENNQLQVSIRELRMAIK
jgi:septation ring formation regulator EzrA